MLTRKEGEQKGLQEGKDNKNLGEVGYGWVTKLEEKGRKFVVRKIIVDYTSFG